MAERPSSPVSSGPDDPEIRILLLGRSGSGKSSCGNTILGENRFKQDETEVCEGRTQIAGKQVCVIDCPDLLDPGLSKEKCERLKEQLMSKCSAGLSSVLITVPLEEPVKNEEEILDCIKGLFGPDVHKYMMILFTHGDELDQSTGQHLTQTDREDLQRLMSECGERFYCFNYKSKSEDLIQDLIHKIEGIMHGNGGKFIMTQIRRSSSKGSLPNFSGESPESSGH